MPTIKVLQPTDHLNVSRGDINDNFAALNAAVAGLGYGGVTAQTGTTYTLLETDNGGIVTFNNASPVAVTVPVGLPIGFSVLLIQLGAGKITPVSGGTGLIQRRNFTKSAGVGAVMSLICYATDAFVLVGDLEP